MFDNQYDSFPFENIKEKLSQKKEVRNKSYFDIIKVKPKRKGCVNIIANVPMHSNQFKHLCFLSRSAIPQIILTFYEAMKAEKEKKGQTLLKKEVGKGKKSG